MRSTESVRVLSDGEELALAGSSPNDSMDPRERASEARSLGDDQDFDQDYDNAPKSSQR
jgi:hypothetical protein